MQSRGNRTEHVKHNVSASQLIRTALILLVFSSPVPAQDESAAETAAPAKVATAPPAAADTAASSAVTEVTQPEAKPPAGWKVFRKGEEVVWCTDGATTGSRVRKERQCMTPQQYQEMTADARRSTEQATRRPLGPIDRD